MLNRVLSAVGRVLIFSGIVLLLWVSFTLWGTSLYESNEQSNLTSALSGELAAAADGPGTKTTASDDPSVVAEQLADLDPQTVGPLAPPPDGEPLGFIQIPKIDLTTRVVVAGVTKSDLRKGPGHYPGTPMPGQAGNAAIAGHRTTYGAPFNRIDELIPGDRIETFTRQGKFVYEVIAPPDGIGIERGAGWYTVRPSEGSVIGPTDDNRLTLTACHPKYSAAQRIVVHAKLVSDVAPTAPTTTTPSSGADADREPASTVTDEDDLIAGDPDEKGPTLLWGGAFLALWALLWFVTARLAKRQQRWWPVMALGAPASLFLLWTCFTHLDRFLPSF